LHCHAARMANRSGAKVRSGMQPQIIALRESDALLEFPAEADLVERIMPSIAPDRTASTCRGEARPAIGYQEFIQMLARSDA
jgi:hypothetical protein